MNTPYGHIMPLYGCVRKIWVEPEELNPSLAIPSSKATVEIRVNGIRVSIKNDPEKTREIHFSQIVSLEYMDESHISKRDKSIVGRAILGGVLLGGAGAVVGGMTGMGKKDKVYNAVMRIVYYSTKDDVFITLQLLAAKNSEKLDVKRTINIYNEYEPSEYESAHPFSQRDLHKSKSRAERAEEAREKENTVYGVLGFVFLIVLVISAFS